MRSLKHALALGTLYIVSAVEPAAAQRIDPMKLIEFHVNAERENVSFNGTEREGARFTFTLDRTQQTYALSLVQRGDGRFDVTVFRRNVLRNDTAYTALETVAATLARPAPLRALPYFTIVIDGTRHATTPLSSLPAVRPILASYTPSLSISKFFGQCCVSCGGITACACAVKAECGWCCEAACCPLIKVPDAMLPGNDTRPLSRLAQGRCKAVPDS